MIRVAIGYDSIEQPWSHLWKHALADGIRVHGDDVVLQPMSTCAALAADVTVTWGLRGGRRGLMRHSIDHGHRHLVMERGFLGDRKQWTALTYDGIAGRGAAPIITDPSRFALHHGALMQPWRKPRDRRALILGQVTGDATIAHVDFFGWACRVAHDLRADGWEVQYRHHPEERAHNQRLPKGAALSLPGPLEVALERTDFAITYNSTSAVNAVLYGVPTYAADHGSPAWAVTSHPPGLVPCTWDRAEWAAQLAWRQWCIEDLRSGAAWGHLRTIAMHPKATHI